MAQQLAQIFVALLAVSVTSGQVLYCPLLGGGTTYKWSPNSVETVVAQTTFSTGSYNPRMNCYIEIQADIPGRVAIEVQSSRLSSYSAAIGIRSTILSGYIADWTELTYREAWNKYYVSATNRLYISFTSRSSPISGSNKGVRLSLTFLRSTACLPGWSPINLSGLQHCVGRPTTSPFKFGDAQRFCNQVRSNLLVSERDNVSTALARVSAVNMWIGMTAEPNGPYSYYRWINNARVDSSQSVMCTGGCTPGSKKHRCVHAVNQRLLSQIDCNTQLQPLCYMPVGGTDLFYAGSDTARVSGALLATSVLLLWGLRR